MLQKYRRISYSDQQPPWKRIKRIQFLQSERRSFTLSVTAGDCNVATTVLLVVHLLRNKY